MHTVLLLAVKGLVGGSLVVVFALLSEVLEPKTFAGVFGAAPSIAIAALLVTDLSDGAGAARMQALAMIVGAVAMGVFCVSAAFGVNRFGALRGSFLTIATWFAAAGLGYAVFLAR